MRLAKVILGFVFITFAAGCDYLPPVTDLSKASNYSDEGEYEKAITHYENALERLSSVSFYRSIEYETRYSYGLMLNEYTKDDNPDYIPVARNQFEWVLSYLEKADELVITKAMVLSTLANTYQQEAGYTEDEEKYYKLLENAYSIYKESANGLEENEDWQNLAYTYYNLGETSEWYGDLAEAIKWLKKAVELDKKHGFDKDLEEDSAYLSRLKLSHQEMLNKQRNADSGADAPTPVR